jgi:surface carbohydrate biosynthesis protein
MKAFLQFLQRAYKYFRSTKRVWCRPPRASLLIIDRGTASPLDEMFAHHNPHIMEIRGESVNMLALLRALPKIHLGAVAYLEAYIDFVKPKLILSRTDNNHTLWQLKRRPNVTYKVALIQNGWRLTVDFEIPALLSPTVRICGLTLPRWS